MVLLLPVISLKKLSHSRLVTVGARKKGHEKFLLLLLIFLLLLASFFVDINKE